MSVLDAKSPYSLYFWLEEFQEEDDWPAVRRTARELLHLSPDNVEGLRLLAESHYQLGDPVEAYRTALRLVEVDPWSIDGHWLLSDLCAQANDPERSADHIEKAAHLIPNSDTVWVAAAKARFALLNLPKCLAAASHGLRVNPQNVSLLLYKTLCLAGLNDLPGAKQSALRLTGLGIDVEEMRSLAKELGIDGRMLSLVQRVSRNQVKALEGEWKPSLAKRTAARTFDGGLELLSGIKEQTKPLTSRQFEVLMKRSQERSGEAEDSVTPEAEEPFEPDLVENRGEEKMFRVYDAYRTHGPFGLEELAGLFRDGTYHFQSAWVCEVEARGEWMSARDCAPLAEEVAFRQ